MKSAQEIRQTFLDYFAERGHRIVPSSPVVPQNDPTLLFINAGMNQFKDVFLGNGSRDYSRAADTQKCVRVSGKHNDLEEVGVDTYHHTFFEMLGNWSFGDYFKEDAIRWAWELLVDVYGLDPERIYVTVFGGDEKDGLEPDLEAERLWPSLTGIAPERVLRFGKKENFWEMGETGPCGPCTEIHYDRGPAAGEIADPTNPVTGVNADSPRVIEIWNLVFIQYDRRPDGSLVSLPAKHVDTGMGFERLTSVLQGKNSNYDTDLFAPIFARIAEVTGVTHGGTMSPADIACRVLADHIRTLCVAFADGVLPGNEGRGYVLRRILRRAARFGRQALAQTEPFIHRLVPAVVEVLGGTFPEIPARADHIALLIESEEKAFAKTLDRGLQLYADLAQGVRKRGQERIAGAEAFDLYATYGFPRDLVELMAREDGLAIESASWDEAEERHRQASRTEGSFGHKFDLKELEGLPATESLFYRAGHGGSGDGLASEARPIKLIERGHLVLDRSPFYAESGGQVGDRGTITGPGFRFEVEETRKVGGIVVHEGRLIEGDPAALPEFVTARVDVARREATMRNHTATHLLHWALREVLGDHATQQGSLVAPDRLRFDVTHPRAIGSDEIERIEALVNGRIVANTALGTTLENLDDARARGVTALFGEKYDDLVRVVDIGGYSTELCGGTHVSATGDIGPFLIVAESAVQAGVRRIEAVTGLGAVARIQEERRLLREAAVALKAKPQDLPTRIDQLQQQMRELKKSGGQKAAADAGGLARELLAAAPEQGGARMVVNAVDLPGKDLAALADVLRNNHGATCGLLAASEEGKVTVVAFASAELAGRVHAGKLVKEIAGMLGGGGGGRPDFAQAGGKEVERLSEALETARSRLREALA
ncbi:MAG: alanine--tRNA ligase [Planctomycetes bacterium]|nr:alanine--tRNA ligase [Planctomycetota bacterium]